MQPPIIDIQAKLTFLISSQRLAPRQGWYRPKAGNTTSAVTVARAMANWYCSSRARCSKRSQYAVRPPRTMTDRSANRKIRPKSSAFFWRRPFCTYWVCWFRGLCLGSTLTPALSQAWERVCAVSPRLGRGCVLSLPGLGEGEFCLSRAWGRVGSVSPGLGGGWVLY